MYEEQKSINIKIDELLTKAAEVSKDGYRIVQICCTRLEGDEIEMNYSFDKDLNFLNFRFNINKDTEIPSISGVYWSAFLYENEMHDLFGLKIKGIAIDFEGKFYKTSVKTPFMVNAEKA